MKLGKILQACLVQLLSYSEDQLPKGSRNYTLLLVSHALLWRRRMLCLVQCSGNGNSYCLFLEFSHQALLALTLRHILPLKLYDGASKLMFYAQPQKHQSISLSRTQSGWVRFYGCQFSIPSITNYKRPHLFMPVSIKILSFSICALRPKNV